MRQFYFQITYCLCPAPRAPRPLQPLDIRSFLVTRLVNDKCACYAIDNTVIEFRRQRRYSDRSLHLSRRSGVTLIEIPSREVALFFQFGGLLTMPVDDRAVRRLDRKLYEGRTIREILPPWKRNSPRSEMFRNDTNYLYDQSENEAINDG